MEHLPRGSRMLEQPVFWQMIKAGLADPSPMEALILAEWLQNMKVSEQYARSKDSQMLKFRKFISLLPPQFQAQPVPEQLAWFAGHEALRRGVRSPATVETYLSQAASAVGTSRRARPVASVLEGLRRIWLYSPAKAPPVPPSQAYRALASLPGLRCRLLGLLWISNALRQGDLARLLAQPVTVESTTLGRTQVIVFKLWQRKGALSGRGVSPELVLPVSEEAAPLFMALFQQLFQAPLSQKERWLQTLVQWRMRHGWQAHSIRRGTSAWMSQMMAGPETIALVLGHAAAVKELAVTKGYTDGLTASERVRKASVLPLPGSRL